MFPVYNWLKNLNKSTATSVICNRKQNRIPFYFILLLFTTKIKNLQWIQTVQNRNIKNITMPLFLFKYPKQLQFFKKKKYKKTIQ